MESPVNVEGQLWEPQALYILQLLNKEDSEVVIKSVIGREDGSQTISANDISKAIFDRGLGIKETYAMVREKNKAFINADLGIHRESEIQQRTVTDVIGAIRRTAFTMQMAGVLLGDRLHPIKK